jgi:hypothetical protein
MIAAPPEKLQRTEVLKTFLGPSPGVDEHDLQYEPLTKVDCLSSSIPHAYNRSEGRLISGTTRLIHLLPGEDFEPIKVSMHISDSITDYEALSYCWGDASTLSPISCNDSRLQVTQNLKSALRDLRYPDRARVLWIDAVCINQQDVSEREQQVSIMGDIYRGATRTVVWLGETFPGDELAFQMVQRLNDAHFDKIKRSIDDGFIVNVVDGTKLMPDGDPTSPTKDEIDALFALLARPWFCRMWVIQEVMLAKKVLITSGDQAIGWDEFAAGLWIAMYIFNAWTRETGVVQKFLQLIILRQYTGIIRRGANEIGASEEAIDEEGTDQEGVTAKTVSEVATENNLALDLLSLLCRFRSYLSTDPRDKIFALLSLTDTDLGSIELVPDYRSSPQEVYIHLAKSILRSSDSLEFLSIPRGTTSFSKSLPSWVPDWSDPVADDPVAWSWENKYEYGNSDFTDSLFQATGQSTTDRNSPSFRDGNALSLSGHRLDRLGSLSNIFPKFEASMALVVQKQTALSASLNDPDEITIAVIILKLLCFIGNFLKHIFIVLIDGTNRIDTLFLWDQMALGANNDKQTAVYPPTGEPLEAAYMATLCVNWMPAGPESALENFRAWRESRRQDLRLRKVKMNFMPVRSRWLITCLELILKFL